MTPEAQLGVLWGKSDAGGRVNLLLQHLLDTAAVAELLWDSFLPSSLRRQVDAVCGGDGRDLFRLLAAMHDLGKATPAFQCKVPSLAARVQAAGLTVGLGPKQGTWRHERASGKCADDLLPWPKHVCEWVWPLLAGHHGLHRDFGDPSPRQHGDAAWETVQRTLMGRLLRELGIDLSDLQPDGAPSRATQLALAGALIVADWLASDEKNFDGVDALDQVSLHGARTRAAKAWPLLGLRGGWNEGSLELTEPVQRRFGMAPRPLQRITVAAAAALPRGGLVVVEAPMGEGKTEAALAAVELLAAATGADGVFVGMPTQATSDAMYERVLAWAGRIDPELPVALLHGKRQHNQTWSSLSRPVVVFAAVDQYGCDDDYGSEDGAVTKASGVLPAEWLLGRKRALLSPLAVGTIDQLLLAATRTKHVSLRHAGLAGKVVVLDEVHAYDVYMAQFLFEALRWLASCGVPVVVLSATLPAGLRNRLMTAYAQGLTHERDVELPPSTGREGYPQVTTLAAPALVMTETCAAWRPSLDVAVDQLCPPQDSEEDDLGQLTALLQRELEDGGCVLILRNTVRRAQLTYQALREVFGEDVELLHARFTVHERARRTRMLLDRLGPPGAAQRPHRLVLVATQVAEQSFDIDVDLLVSDLAPIDLLLQRAGRLHRHERALAERPERLRTPRLVITGLVLRDHAEPSVDPGSAAVYGLAPLLRTALLVREVVGGTWSVPADVPALVARGYELATTFPSGWAAAAALATEEEAAQAERRADAAALFLLGGESAVAEPTLQGLHQRSIGDVDEDRAQAVVRDGPETVEVLLVRKVDGGWTSLAGRPLGPTGAAAIGDDRCPPDVLGDVVRLPARPALTDAALALPCLPGWTGDPWLGRTHVLALDEQGRAELGGRRLTWLADLGLVDEPAR